MLNATEKKGEEGPKGDSDPAGEESQGQARTLLFLVGFLDGEVSDALTALPDRFPSEPQAIIATVAFPPSHEGPSRRRAAILELEELTSNDVAVVAFESDQALRRLPEEDPIGSFQGILADEMAQAVSGITDLILVSGEVNGAGPGGHQRGHLPRKHRCPSWSPLEQNRDADRGSTLGDCGRVPACLRLLEKKRAALDRFLFLRPTGSVQRRRWSRAVPGGGAVSGAVP